MTKPAIVFALGMIALALGYQIHFALDSAPLFLRFSKAGDLQWLMPLFWSRFQHLLECFQRAWSPSASAVTRVMGGAARSARSPFCGASGAQP